MNDPTSERDAFEQVAAEFLDRHRRGDRPTVSEYALAHPELADQIRDLFPAVLFAEQIGHEPKSTGPADRPAIGEYLGEYRLLREVGRGGMGIVYEAEQESLGRHVALKVLPFAGLANQTFRERFQREARAAAQMHHSNIVPVFAVGEHEGIHYYAMQFIHGQSLDAVLREVQSLRGKALTKAGRNHTAAARMAAGVAESLTSGRFASLTPSDSKVDCTDPSDTPSGLSSHSDVEYFRGVARVGLQVAQALAYAHRQGILHRDIKPANLLIDTRGTVWVTDFGLAKTEGDEGLTHTGDLVGTLRYMAPERFRGESVPAGDVYSLGVTLYELLTLRPAFFETDRARLLQQVLHEEPPSPCRLDRRVPRDLETIALRAMAKEPRDRYATADLLADDLQRFLADRPILARPAPLTERAWRWCRRNPRLAPLTGLVALLLLVILIGSPIVSFRLLEQSKSIREQLWAAHLARANAQRSTNEAGRRFHGLESLDAALQLLPHLKFNQVRTLELRNEFIACLSLADLGIAKQWEGYSTESAAVAFDAGLERYARSDEQGAITIRRVDDDREVALLPGPGMGAWALKFSPDGRYLAAGYHRKHLYNAEQFKVWDCERREAVLDVVSPSGCGEADFSPDSRRVAFARDNTTLTIHDLTGESTDDTIVQMAVLPNQLAFHPNGRQLAVVQRLSVEVRDAATGKVLAQRAHPKEVWSLAWSADGMLLAAGSRFAIYLWAEGAAQARAILNGHEHLITALAFNNVGDLLASKSHDGTVRLWDVEAERQLLRTSSVHTGCAPMLFSRDDRRLGFASDGSLLWLWDVARGSECRTFFVRQPLGLSSKMANFSHDGALLAVVGNDGVRICDWSAGREVAYLPLPECASALFSTDGRACFTSSKLGVHRWPIVADGHTGGSRIGPREVVGAVGPLQQADLSRDGQTMVTRHDAEALVVNVQQPGKTIAITEHPQLHYIAISPDGRWVATGALDGSRVKIWNATTGEPRQTLPVDASAAVSFSPDGRWLVVATGKEYGFWDVATWQRNHTVAKQPQTNPADVAFTKDGSLMAVRHSLTRLRLIRPATGVTLAELQSPGQQTLTWHALSPDGRRLAAGGPGSVVHVWDLDAIRRQLSARGLDWDSPGKATGESAASPPVLPVTVDLTGDPAK